MARDGAQDSRRDSLTGRVVRGAAFSAAGYASAQALHLIGYAILARLITPAEFGTYAAATVLLGFSMLVADSGMAAAVVQRRDREDEAAATAAIAIFVNGLALSLVALALSPLLGLLFDSTQVRNVAAAMSGIVALRALSSAPDAILQRRLSFRRQTIVEPAQVIVFAVTAIIAASNDMGPWALVVGYYAAAVADVALTWILAGWLPRLRLATMGMWRELVGFGRHVFASTFIQQAGQQTDAIIIGPLLGRAPLGQYRYGYRLAATPLQAFMAAAAYVLFPALAQISHDRDRARAAFLRALGWMSLVTIPVSLSLIALGETLAVVLFGEVWREGGQAAAALGGFAAASMATATATEGIKAVGEPRHLTPIAIFGVTLTALLMLAMVPLGLIAVAIGMSAGAIATSVFAFHRARAAIGFEWSDVIRRIVPPLAASLWMAAALLGLEQLLDAESHSTLVTIAFLALEALAGAVAYLVALRLISPVSARELGAGLAKLAARLGLRPRSA